MIPCQCGMCTSTTAKQVNLYKLPGITLEEIRQRVADGTYSHVSHNIRYAWVTYPNGAEHIYRVVKQHWPPMGQNVDDLPNIVRGTE